MSGYMRAHWTKLTEADLQHIAGNRDLLLGHVQAQYALSKADAERQLEGWLVQLATPDDRVPLGGAKPPKPTTV